MARLLLLSNSTNPGTPYLSWARDRLGAFVPKGATIAFVPFAGVRLGWDQYALLVAQALVPLGVTVRSVHQAPDPVALVREADVIAVGGGNTFHLLKHLQEQGLIGPIRERVAAGAGYVGWSAGSNVACPTIRTTNDMPIVEPAGFRALSLVPFQINAHYTEAALPDHGGETRPERLAEFVAVNPGVWVVGLREGSLISVDGTAVRLEGGPPATVFGNGEPAEHPSGADLGFLLQRPAAVAG